MSSDPLDDRAQSDSMVQAAAPAARDRRDFAGICGTTLKEMYRIVRVVGDGGFGVVYEALHLEGGFKRAIKCLQVPPDADEAKFLADFRNEAKLLEVLCTYDAGIVQSKDFGTFQMGSGRRVPYLV